MKKTVIKFGLFGFLTACILFLLSLLLGGDTGYGSKEILGYSAIVLSLLFVFFGIKNFRDKENDGVISFGKALGVGMLITLFAALGFAIIDFIYTSYIDPEFMQNYLNHSIEKLQQEHSGEELATKTAELKASFEGMTSFTLALFMFGIVTLIGFIISLISSLVLNKK